MLIRGRKVRVNLTFLTSSINPPILLPTHIRTLLTTSVVNTKQSTHTRVTLHPSALTIRAC
jgi:hypothetical protein